VSGKHLGVDERLTREVGKAIAAGVDFESWTGRLVGAGGIVVFLLMAILVLLPARASARATAAGQVSVGISVSFGPPPLPVYAQPMCPGPGYIWTPGYWAYDNDDGYYWVPGTWVMAPFQGALWTPGYWGWDPAAVVFVWHPGYWGLSVGFYGGINYGFGYFGDGYDGGYWRHGAFFYNRAWNHIDRDEIRHVYYRERFHDRDWDRDRERVSYNGGRGGIDARPTWDDFRAEHERRMGPIREQDRHERMARRMPEERWSENHGRPGIAATARPERFRGDGVVRASRDGGPYHQQYRDRARPEGGQWHSFGDPPNGRRAPADSGYRDMQRRDNSSRDNQGQQRGNSGRDQMRQSQGQPGGWRQQPDQRGNRGGWQQPQQQQRDQSRPDQRQQMRQPQGRDYPQQRGSWKSQQARPQQDRRGGQARGQGGNSGRQQARPNKDQRKPEKQHGRHR
jgi:hypothetical protein